jgi:hypothetical protein
VSAPRAEVLQPPGERFSALLQAAAAPAAADPGASSAAAATPSVKSTPPPFALAQAPPAVNQRQVAAAYQQQSGQPPSTQAPVSQMSDMQKYKDDQLLRNPGGDHYFLDQKKVVADPPERKSLWGRLKKNLADSFGNVKNFFSNLLFGQKVCYRDQSEQIKETSRKGLIGSIGDFFKDLGSGLTFGKWRPDGEKAPQGFLERMGFAVSKMKEAFSIDLFHGVLGSVNHMAGNLVLAGWNLMQVVPDATIGNFEAGKKLTTTIFDDGQVVVEYLTDIMPSGDAWLRVHAPNIKDLKPPILYNLGMPEHYDGDVRWQHIRNTPFRKAIETIGSLLADVAMVGTVGPVKFLSEDSHKKALP